MRAKNEMEELKKKNKSLHTLEQLFLKSFYNPNLKGDRTSIGLMEAADLAAVPAQFLLDYINKDARFDWLFKSILATWICCSGMLKNLTGFLGGIIDDDKVILTMHSMKMQIPGRRVIGEVRFVSNETPLKLYLNNFKMHFSTESKTVISRTFGVLGLWKFISQRQLFETIAFHSILPLTKFTIFEASEIYCLAESNLFKSVYPTIINDRSVSDLPVFLDVSSIKLRLLDERVDPEILKNLTQRTKKKNGLDAAFCRNFFDFFPRTNPVYMTHSASTRNFGACILRWFCWQGYLKAALQAEIKDGRNGCNLYKSFPRLMTLVATFGDHELLEMLESVSDSVVEKEMLLKWAKEAGKSQLVQENQEIIFSNPLFAAFYLKDERLCERLISIRAEDRADFIKSTPNLQRGCTLAVGKRNEGAKTYGLLNLPSYSLAISAQEEYSAFLKRLGF